eukprot:189280_1
MQNRVCCCITWAPRFFTWDRTYVIRSFLKLYVSISCLLAMVLYVEFFMNLFVEYLITCLVHHEDYYIYALSMVPILLFVCDMLIRLAWQAVVVSWSLNCDANGDLEAADAQVGLYALRSRLISTNNLNYTFANDARDNNNFDMWVEEQEDLYDDRMKEAADEEAKRKKALKKKSQSYKDFKLNELDEHKRNDIELTTKTGKETEEDLVDKTKKTLKATGDAIALGAAKTKETLSDAADVMVTGVEDAGLAMQDIAVDVADGMKKLARSISGHDDDKTPMTPSQQKAECIKQIQRAKDKEHFRQKMADYFMATCWRLGFFFYSMIFACLGAWSVEVDVAVNGFFWQLVMRYCVLGGVVWSMVYCVGAFFVSISSRFRSWKLIHAKLPRWKLFFLIDARDYETNNVGWTRIKFMVMGGSIMIALVTIVTSYFYIEEKWSSFIHFVGIVFALYYFINLFMACKPYALYALWTDSIPPPGRNYTAHQIASETLRDQNLLANSLRSSKNVTQDVADEDSATMEDQLHELDFDAPKTVTLSPENADTKITLTTPASTASTVSNEEERKEAYQEVAAASPIGNGELQMDRDPIASASQSDSAKKGGRARTDTLKRQKDKKKFKSFRSQRTSDLQRRYKAFFYEYRATDREDFAIAKDKIMLMDCAYMKALAIAFLANYEQYWLNVYRPFDEYDIESNLSSTHILAGFQWMKSICRCQLQQRRKKNCRQRCWWFCKYLMDNFCNICVVITTLGFMFVLFQTSQRLSGNDEAFRDTVHYEKNSTAYYGICSDTFGSDDIGGEYQMSVLDITVLTQLAYEADNYDLCGLIDVWFNNSFELIKIHREEPFYFHMRHKYQHVDIIAIRGTDNVIEMMQDLSLFVEVVIFEGLQWIVPFLNGLPISFVRQILYYASYIEGVINADSRTAFDEPVFEYATKYLARLESECGYESDTIQDWKGATTLHFVGHSLGGAIAEIVAANLHELNLKSGIKSSMQSFGVCSPGVLLSSAKFGFGVEALDKTSSSLLPRRDLVSSVDFHGGSTQYTECEAGNPLQCHVMDNVLCQLFHGCPRDLADSFKRKVLTDFCETSEADDSDDKPQIGKSILKFRGNAFDEVSDWHWEKILDKCDAGVYDRCDSYNDQLYNCSSVYDAEDSEDICYSEAALHS